MKKEIVKVQRPLIRAQKNKMVLMYNENQSHWFEGETTSDVIKAMRGREKAYFYAELPKKSGYVKLLGVAPEQDW